MFKSPWVGLMNFKYFFVSGSAWMLTRNTLLYNIIFIAVGTVFRIIMAILIYEMCTNRYKKIVQTLMFLPHFLSWVVIGGLAYNALNYEFGIINSILVSFGAEKIDFYSNI
jgi:putative aldouronate transport system permease protein